MNAAIAGILYSGIPSAWATGDGRLAGIHAFGHVKPANGPFERVQGRTIKKTLAIRVVERASIGKRSAPLFKFRRMIAAVHPEIDQVAREIIVHLDMLIWWLLHEHVCRAAKQLDIDIILFGFGESTQDTSGTIVFAADPGKGRAQRSHMQKFLSCIRRYMSCGLLCLVFL